MPFPKATQQSRPDSQPQTGVRLAPYPTPGAADEVLP